MPTTGLKAACWLAVACSLAGCAPRLQQGPAGVLSPCSFWPPPRSSLHWVAEALPEDAERGATTATVAQQLAAKLHHAGYTELHWYPIGLGHRHGFALTTRLEALDGDTARSRAEPERWSELHREPASLRWLALARRVPLPHPGRYRALLIAFTDLPHAGTSIAPRWNEDTIMAGPGVDEHAPIPQALGTSDYRLGVHVYIYERRDDEEQGHFREADVDGATEEAQLAALAELDSIGFAGGR